MGEFKRLAENKLVVSVTLAVALILLASGLIVSASLQGWPPQFFRFTGPEPNALPVDADIAGWAGFDKHSYHLGEPALYRIRILWRNSVINPDLVTFKNGIGLFPFHRREVTESRRELAGDVSEYILDYRLQAVDVEPSSSHILAPPTVYFTHALEGEGELQSFRIAAPEVHIGGYYPRDVSGIPLLDLKGGIRDPESLRQWLMFLNGALILVFAAFLVWQFGRVRKKETLTEPERLWKRFHGLDRGTLDNRAWMMHCEDVLTDLLQYRLNLTPEEFWAGRDPADEHWKNIVHRARELFCLSYLPPQPGDDAVNEADSLLNRAFSGIVEEERLKREQEPSFFTRLSRQPGVIVLTGIFALTGISMLILAALPGAWISRGMVEYNDTLELVNDDATLARAYEEFTGLADRLEDGRIKAAALYNAGTLASYPVLAGLDRAQQEALLAVMFQEQRVFLDALLHSMRMEDPFLLVAMIRDSLRFLIQGETSLKAAVRIDPADEDIRRNLELTVKRRMAYSKTIQELMQEGEDDSGLGQMERQAIMDLERFMEMEMPEQYSEREEGKNDKDYFILEGF